MDQRKKMMRTVLRSLQAWLGVLLQELNAGSRPAAGVRDFDERQVKLG